jgi:hypothetical protein
LEVETLDKPFEGTVQVLTISSTEVDMRLAKEGVVDANRTGGWTTLPFLTSTIVKGRITVLLTRSRPEAYLIPVAWAGLAERLKVAGLEVETLDKPRRGSLMRTVQGGGPHCRS